MGHRARLVGGSARPWAGIPPDPHSACRARRVEARRRSAFDANGGRGLLPANSGRRLVRPGRGMALRADTGQDPPSRVSPFFALARGARADTERVRGVAACDPKELMSVVGGPVTGATGFVGDACRALGDRDWEVRCLVRDPSRARELADRGFELHEATCSTGGACGAGRGSRCLLPDPLDGSRGGGDFEERERRGARTSRRWRSAKESPGSSISAGSVTARSPGTSAAACGPLRSSRSLGRR